MRSGGLSIFLKTVSEKTRAAHKDVNRECFYQTWGRLYISDGSEHLPCLRRQNRWCRLNPHRVFVSETCRNVKLQQIRRSQKHAMTTFILSECFYSDRSRNRRKNCFISAKSFNFIITALKHSHSNLHFSPVSSETQNIKLSWYRLNQHRKPHIKNTQRASAVLDTWASFTFKIFRQQSVQRLAERHVDHLCVAAAAVTEQVSVCWFLVVVVRVDSVWLRVSVTRSGPRPLLLRSVRSVMVAGLVGPAWGVAGQGRGRSPSVLVPAGRWAPLRLLWAGRSPPRTVQVRGGPSVRRAEGGSHRWIERRWRS